MITPPLKIAVAGHSNTGKTSFMRTVMRDVDFGEVSDRPAVTRHVEKALLRASGGEVIEFFDTPGLEDSISLLEHLEALRADRRIDGIDVLGEFLESTDARERFLQEAKALRQVLASDAALYVVDVRDGVHGKHRDELAILGMCARPIVPVLNFTADADAKTVLWREHLGRANMHAVAEFDTVVYDAQDERRLLEKMRTLLDPHAPTLDAFIADRVEQRRVLIRSSTVLLAEMLIDVASHVVSVAARDRAAAGAAREKLRDAVRQREQRCVKALLALHRFRPDDVAEANLDIEDGAWGLDLFSPEAMREFTYRAGEAAATGAMVGLTLDIMLAGLSLGTGAAAGAAIGGLFGATRVHGRRLVNRARGLTELRCDDDTLRLLAARQIALVAVLLRRGHAALKPVTLDQRAGDQKVMARQAIDVLRRARIHPGWSRLAEPAPLPAASEPARQEAVADLAAAIRAALDAAEIL